MRRRLVSLTFGFVLAVAAAPFAQAPGTGIAANLQGQYNNLKNNLTQAADKVSAADYGFKVGTTAEARTFGQLFGHIANAQFGQCAGAKGVPNPNQGKNLEELTTKADVVKALADSFAFCDDAFASLTDQSALEVLTGGRGGPSARAVGLYGLIVHSNEMYGTAAAYLRSRDIVPPSTENQGRRGGGGGRGRGGQ
jgi:hypothetical protein